MWKLIADLQQHRDLVQSRVHFLFLYGRLLRPLARPCNENLVVLVRTPMGRARILCLCLRNVVLALDLMTHNLYCRWKCASRVSAVIAFWTQKMIVDSLQYRIKKALRVRVRTEDVANTGTVAWSVMCNFELFTVFDRVLLPQLILVSRTVTRTGHDSWMNGFLLHGQTLTINSVRCWIWYRQTTGRVSLSFAEHITRRASTKKCSPVLLSVSYLISDASKQPIQTRHFLLLF